MIRGLVLIFLGLILTLKSQVYRQTDSLLNVIAIQENDTNKILNLKTLSKNYVNKDINKAVEYSRMIQTLSKDLNYPNGIADYYYLTSIIKNRKGELDSSLFYSELAIESIISIGDSKRLAENYRSYAITLRKLGHSSSSKDFLFKALNLYFGLQDTISLAKTYNSLGICHLNMSNYDSAAVYFTNSIHQYELVHLNERCAYPTLNLGKVYFLLEDYDKAKKYYRRSSGMFTQLSDTENIALSYQNLGMVYATIKEWDSAKFYYDKALENYKTTDSKVGIGNNHNNLGSLFESKSMYDSAFILYNKALAIFKASNYIGGQVTAYTNLAVIHHRFGDYDKMFSYYDTSLNLARKIDDRRRVLHIYQNLATSYSDMSNFRQAYTYQQRYDKLKDSILDIDKAKIIADLELRYESEKNAARILSLQNESLQKDLRLKKRTGERNLFALIGFFAFIIFILVILIARQRIRKNNIIKEKEIQRLREEKKALAAKALVEGQEEERKRVARELHDGLGVLLSNVKMQFSNYIDKNPDNSKILEKATSVLDKASSDVRRISHNMMPGILTKMGLKEAVEDIIDDINDLDDLNAELLIKGGDKRLPENMEIMLYRVIQEMINNTLKHAQASEVSLVLDIRVNEVRIQYSDNGSGFNVDEVLKRKTLGLRSIESRIQFFDGEMEIKSTVGKGSSFIVYLPV